MLKKIILVLAFLALISSPTNGAKAWSGCGSYVTVQWGDTLSGLAASCGTTMDAILSANPGLGWWLYAGQVIYVPVGYNYYPAQYPTSNTYIVQPGDSMGAIAARYGISFYDLWAANPQIWNPSLIYVGQALTLPALYAPPVGSPSHPNPSYPPVNPSGNTLKITYKNGLFVRDAPGGNFVGWANYDEYKEWCYYPGSITKDAAGKVWVQVDLDPPQKGYTTGWILIKDQYGSYFTTLIPGW